MYFQSPSKRLISISPKMPQNRRKLKCNGIYPISKKKTIEGLSEASRCTEINRETDLVVKNIFFDLLFC
jgi:hypothetical protein